MGARNPRNNPERVRGKHDDVLRNHRCFSDIPRSPGVDLGPKVERVTAGNEEFADYPALVGSLIWTSVMTRPDITNALRACARHSHT